MIYKLSRDLVRIMNKNEKSKIVEVIERLVRVETLIESGFRQNEKDHSELKVSVSHRKEEYKELEKRVDDLEMRYEKRLIYWKLMAALGSPIVTSIIVTIACSSIGII